MRAKFLNHIQSNIKDNNNEKSIQFNIETKSNHRFPLLNINKSNSYHRKLIFHLPEKIEPLSKSNNDKISKDDVKEGVAWYKSEYFKIPKLILSQKINKIKTPLSERKLSLTKSHDRRKYDKYYSSVIKGEFPFMNKLDIKREINEVLGLKREKSELNIFSYKPKEIDFDKYIKKLGVLKFLDERMLKLVRVGKVNNSVILPDKNSIEEKLKTIKNNKDLLPRYMMKRKIFERKNNSKISRNKSYDNILKKKIEMNNKKILEKSLKKINLIKDKRISLIQKQIYQYNEVFKDVNDKLLNFYDKKRKDFEKIIESEFPTRKEYKT